MRATQRLIARGFEAYLVGGCVRDLLLDRTPKDYDIATEARPPQVKRTFPRNCRIIGRRFKLAHLHFHNNTKILECSTFRRTPQLDTENDLLITRDNEFGTAEEDALRRDFTVNALFLDPTRNTILDYTNGLEDLRARVIRTIGDPRVRFREDPVRILRAAKFAGRLGFSVDPDTFTAMCETSGDLMRAAPPRLFEEILRLLRGGHALDSFQLLRDVGALKSLVPVLADFLARARHDQRVAFWRLLEALDQRVLAGGAPPPPALRGARVVGPVLAAAAPHPERSPSSIAEELLGPLSLSLRLPRRDAGCLKRICGVQHRFLQLDVPAQAGGARPARFRVEGFVHGPYFDEALELFDLRMHAVGDTTDTGDRDALDLIAAWQDLAGGSRRPFAGQPLTDHDDSEAGDRVWRPGPAMAEATDGDEAGGEGEGDEPVATDEDGEPGDAPRRRRRRRRGGRRRRRGGTDDLGPGELGLGERASGERGDDADAFAEEPPPFDDTDAGASDDAEVRAARPFPTARDDGEAADALPRTDTGGEQAGGEGWGEGGRFPRDAGDGADDDVAGDASGDVTGDTTSGGEPGRRRRRRRRRRGRGQREGDDHFPASTEPSPHGEGIEPPRERHTQPADAGQAGAPRQRDQRDVHRQPRDGGQRGGGQRGGGQRGGGQRGGGQRGGGQHGGGQHGEQRGERDDRGGRRRKRRHDRNGNHGQGQPRDVDVVPRYRDRRGKVDVIEPAALDLSAFDVELDPKRVPTFGSIVEGKNRPKRRSPRVPEDGVDDYRPPPPPGSDQGPGAPPPPPPRDAPDDTFGDW